MQIFFRGVIIVFMKAIIVSENQFPSGDAGSIKYTNLSELLRFLGYEPFFIGYGLSNYKEIITFKYGKYVSLRKGEKSKIINRIRSRINFRKRILNYANSIVDCGDLVIISSSFPLHQCRFLQKTCRRKKAKVVFSVVEYYSRSEFPLGGIFSPSFNNCNNFFKNLKPQDGSVMSISNYISNFFSNKGINTVVVPFAFSEDFCEYHNALVNNEKIELIYAGNPAKKDLLLEMLRAIELLSAEEKAKIHLSIYGVTKQWLRHNCKKDEGNSIQEFASFYGYVTNERISNAYSSSDFSILLRPFDARYAKAGFPTKISESMFHGIPPITNFTSDLSSYLVANENCIEVKGEDKLAFASALKRVLALSPTQKMLLKKNARKTAEQKLNIMSFSQVFKTFLNKAQ